MKTVLDKTTRKELIKRINSINEDSTAQWGKMNAYQMLKHCRLAEEMYLGKKNYEWVSQGRVFGKAALEKFLNDETPMSQNIMTTKDFIVTNTGSVAEEKEKLISLICEYENYPDGHVTHWFFGPMSREQVGLFSYKHLDHHLRQFNV